jgi:adenosylcobinamide-GDP ribazoletransferase
VLAFLTILPTGKQSHDIHYVAKNMYLFPVAGLVIGAIIGAMAFGISPFLHPLLVGLLVTGALVIITGVHHTDALADFADGLMAKGGKEVKRKAMLDPAVGSAGVAALVMYFAGMIIVFHSGFSSGFAILTSIIAAEVIAKYVMVLLANRGLSAWEGFSSPFTAAMKDRRKIVAATGIMLAIVWLASSYAGLIALGVSLAITGLMKYVSGRSFGGISGDVLGASNEMTRLSSLIVLSSLPTLPLVTTIF